MGRMSGSADHAVTEAVPGDVDDIASLASVRRQQYEQAQPQFWKQAPDAVEQHARYLASLVGDDHAVSLVARDGDRLLGFVSGSLVEPPPVYAPGGPSGFIDDFVVADDADWSTVGTALLAAARERLAERGAAQVVVVCGHHDEAKMSALVASGLSRASEWLVAPARDGGDVLPTAG
jgi:GNAT superfamily N-acetyltransferase